MVKINKGVCPMTDLESMRLLNAAISVWTAAVIIAATEINRALSNLSLVRRQSEFVGERQTRTEDTLGAKIQCDVAVYSFLPICVHLFFSCVQAHILDSQMLK